MKITDIPIYSALAPYSALAEAALAYVDVYEHLFRLKRDEKESTDMAYPKGFSPFRYHPGATKRSLTPTEVMLVGTPCPHCGNPLTRQESSYSEYVSCPSDYTMYFDPTETVPGRAWRRFSAKTAPVEVAHDVTAPSTMETVVDAAIKPSWKKISSSGRHVSAVTIPAELKKLLELKADGKSLREAMERTLLEEHVKAIEHAKAMQGVEGVGPHLEKPATEKDTSGKFPYLRFRKLVDAVQAAYKQGKIGSGFSLRRELMAARLWSALRAQGVSEDHSLQLAFALVGSERASDDERPFYEELWRAQMASHLYPLPQLETPESEKGGTWHPQAGLAALAIRARVPLWLSGEAGAGKTHLTRQIAKLLGLPYVRLQGSRDRTVDDVIGAWGYDPAVGSVFRAGVVVDAARNGGLLHIDEVSALPHEVTFELHAVLEGEPLTVLKNSGEKVELSDRFAIVANDNSVGEGEQAAYVGLHATNLAFRDRWAFLRVEQMPDDLRKKLVMKAAQL